MVWVRGTMSVCVCVCLFVDCGLWSVVWFRLFFFLSKRDRFGPFERVGVPGIACPGSVTLSLSYTIRGTCREWNVRLRLRTSEVLWVLSRFEPRRRSTTSTTEAQLLGRSSGRAGRRL